MTRSSIVLRIQGILLRPKREWRRIKEESLSVSGIFSPYAVILAAIPLVSRFLAGLFYGAFKRPYTGWSWDVVRRELLFSVSVYLFSLIVVYLWGRIIDLLAPVFSSRRSRERSMALAVYTMTLYWLGGLFYLIPQWGWILRVIAGFYGLIILYWGLVEGLMETPSQRVWSYLALSSLFVLLLIGCVDILLRGLFTLGGLLRF